MPKTQTNYWLNLIKLWRNNSLLHPLVVTYYLTTNGNLMRLLQRFWHPPQPAWQ
jgi:hypothetical protein